MQLCTEFPNDRVTPDVNCDISTSTTIASTYEKYVRERSRQVTDESGVELGLSAKFKGATASVDFGLKSKHELEDSSIYKAFVDDRKEVATTKAVCYTTDLAISTLKRPLFTSMFVTGLTMLNSALNLSEAQKKETYVKFTKEFGTHFVLKADFGAGFSMHRLYNNRSNSQEQEKHRKECMETSVNFCLKVGLDLETYGGSAKSCIDNKHSECMENKETTNTGSSYSTERTIITTRGVRGGDIDGLLKNDLSPVPIKLEVVALQELMVQEWLNANKEYNMPETLDAAGIKALLTKGLDNWYCQDVLHLTQANCYTPNIERRCGLNDDCAVGTLCIPNSSASKGYDCEKQSRKHQVATLSSKWKSLIVAHDFLQRSPFRCQTTAPASGSTARMGNT